jgi:hypothetical protein
VLVRNSDNKKNLGGKQQPLHLVVIQRHSLNGSYVLAKLDGSLSKLWYGAAQLVPYLAHTAIPVDISHLLDMPAKDLNVLALPDEPDLFKDIADNKL